MARNCPICKHLPESQDGYVKEAVVGQDLMAIVNCPRCGRFGWPQPLLDTPRRGEDLTFRLSAASRRAADEGTMLEFQGSESAAEIAAATPPPRTFSGYYDAVVSELASFAKLPGRETRIDPVHLAARTFLGLADCENLLRQIREEDLITVTDGERQRFTVRLTFKGWQRADAVERHGNRLNRAFVAMWFNPEVKLAYMEGIRPALIACGYKPPFRVDDSESDELWKVSPDDARDEKKIDDRILAGIRRSRFVVADFTGDRPSVYYETGFAEGLGVDVIWTCRKDWVDKLSVDTRQNDHILWTTPAELHAQVTARIERRGWRTGA